MLETDRLILRQWKESDYLPFVTMGLDPEVMQYFPGLLTKDESLGFIKILVEIIDKSNGDFGR